MSAGQEHEGVSQQLVRRGSLLRTEAVRLGSRRLIQVLLALGVLVFCAGLVLGVTAHAKPTAAGLVDAEQRRQQFAIEEERFRVDCLSDVGTPDGPTEADCGPPRTPLLTG